MLWTLIDEGYEVSVASSLDQVADEAMNGEKSRFVEVSGSSERVEVHSVAELKNLLRGKDRFYVYPEEWPCNDWTFKCQRHK